MRVPVVSKTHRVPKYTSAVFSGDWFQSRAHTEPCVCSSARFFGGEGQPNVDVECDYLKIQQCHEGGTKEEQTTGGR